MRADATATSTSWWALTCGLLDRFAASGTPAPNGRADARCDSWVDVTVAAEDVLRGIEPHTPWPPAGLATALQSLVGAAVVPADAAHAVAWVLDERYSRTFPDDWAAAATSGTWELAPEEPYPVLDSPWSLFHPHLSRAASLTDPGRDELPHVRRFRPTARQRDKVARVEVHRVHTLLRDVLAPLERVATAHPNVGWDEMEWPSDGVLWPVQVRDASGQDARIRAAVRDALAAGCRLIVLPELSATGRTASEVQAVLDDHLDRHEDAAIVIAGSRHVTDPAAGRRNRAETVLAGTALRLTHDKLVPFRIGADMEALDNALPTLHLYQDGPFRFAVAICKDLLDADVHALLGALGVNLLATPAMSSKTGNFPHAAGGLLNAAQTFTIVANGPLAAVDGSPLPACSITGRPTSEHEAVRAWPLTASAPLCPVRVVHPPGSEPVAASRVRGR
ncbi:MAG TPA: hypothetical protein VFT50_03430 [Baekduia sp.]|nr:hypothetical protein [Baekduia sp.]